MDGCFLVGGKMTVKTMLVVEICPGVEVFMTAQQKAIWDKYCEHRYET